MYYLLTAYYAEWPLIFFGLLTVVGAAYAHGGKYLMKDIGDMSKMPLTHYISAHLSVLYASVIPIIMAVRSDQILWLTRIMISKGQRPFSSTRAVRVFWHFLSKIEYMLGDP